MPVFQGESAYFIKTKGDVLQGIMQIIQKSRAKSGWMRFDRL